MIFALLLALPAIVALVFLVDHLLRLPGDQEMADLENKYILITGCDTGFGNMLAKHLDQMGCHVFAGCLSKEAGVKLEKDTSIKLKAIPMDVGNHSSVKEAYEVVKDTLPGDKGLWAVVNNAAIPGKSGPSEFHTKECFQEVFNVNLLGVIDVTNTFLPLLKKGKGRIINTSSVSGRLAFPMIPAYSISKWGVEAFSDCVRLTAKPFSVKVSIIEPGGFGTPINDASAIAERWWNHWNGLPQHIKDDYGEAYIEKSINNVAKHLKTADPRVHIVVNTYIHALFSRKPRKRYSVGTTAAFISIPMSYLPSWITDRIMSKNFPIPSKAVVQD